MARIYLAVPQKMLKLCCRKCFCYTLWTISEIDFLFIFISFLAATALYTLCSRKKSYPYIFPAYF